MEWINTILVCLLVLITAFYAWRTHGMFKEMVASRKASALPRLKLSLNVLGSVHGNARVTNVGSGTAIEPMVEIWVDGEEGRRTWQSQLMAPGQYQDIFFPKTADGSIPTLDQIMENWNTLHMKAGYKDIFGDYIEIQDKIDMREYIAVLKASSARVYRDVLQDIRDELERIRKGVDKIGS